MSYYDDGVGSDITQQSENGTTLGTRITLAGSTDLPNSGLNAGFEIIIEPNQTNNTPLIFSNQSTQGDGNGSTIGVLGNSVNVSGGFGKVTVGLQSMPTDNIAVLEDPSLTLWSSISPVFHGNGFTIRGLGATAGASLWGDFLECMGANGLSGAGGIGIDCNGIYRNGLRYDLPAFGPVTVAVGYANDDIFDIAAKYKGALGGVNSQLAIGYSNNSSGAAAYGGSGSDTFQLQAGLMDPNSGIFGSIAWQSESGDKIATAATGTGAITQDDTDAWWLKVGIKKAFNSFGDTSFAFQYGQYNDQYGTAATAAGGPGVNANGTPVASLSAAVANPGIIGSEVERIGVEINQYFGSRLIIYGAWEQLDLDVDCSTAVVNTCAAAYGGAQELDTFTLGTVFFF
jgi:hypothetical protein